MARQSPSGKHGASGSSKGSAAFLESPLKHLVSSQTAFQAKPCTLAIVASLPHDKDSGFFLKLRKKLHTIKSRTLTDSADSGGLREGDR